MFNKFIFGKDIFLKTKYPIAFDSPDHLDPEGGAQSDFTDGSMFADELKENFLLKIKLLDLGTAVGTVPLSMRKKGFYAIGLEGSDASKNRKMEGWRTHPGILSTCDISRPFRIENNNSKIVHFDFITAWSVIEHIYPDRLDVLFNNIKNHLEADGYGIFKIDLGNNKWHQSINLDWVSILNSYFVIDYDIEKLRDWNYCRPTKEELIRARINDPMITKYSGCLFFWVKQKG